MSEKVSKPKAAPAVKTPAKATGDKKPTAKAGVVKTKLSAASKELADSKKVLSSRTPATAKKPTDRNKVSVDNAKLLKAMQEQTKKTFT